MKKFVPIVFILLVTFITFSRKENAVVTKAIPANRTIAAVQPKPAPKTPLPEKKNFVVKEPVARHQGDRIIQRVPQSLRETFEQDPSINITRGHIFVTNVGAIAKENYQSSMGDILYSDGIFNYVRSNGQSNLIPVALSPSTGKLHPISSVLHVLNATEAIRSEVKGLGLTEYYYHAGMKLLSLKSTSSQVIPVYSDLKDRGFEVQLEVIKPHQQGI